MRVVTIHQFYRVLFRFLSQFGFFIVALSIATTAYAANLSRHEELFLRHVAEGGYAEFEASRLATTRSSSLEIQKFSTDLLSDQRVIALELAQLALAKAVTLPEVPSKMQQATILRLSKFSGDHFDKEYSREIGVLALRDMVALFQQAQKRAKDADVKEFAIKTLPMLEQRLTQGQILKLKIDKRNVKN